MTNTPGKITGRFVLQKRTEFADLAKGDIVEIGESDLCFQNNEAIYQFNYERPDQEEKYTIKPGKYMIETDSGSLRLSQIELRSLDLLDSIDNTAAIISEARKFFSRLHVYDKRKRPKKRAVLLYSRPGLGKSSAIAKFCNDFSAEDPGTVIINWPTSTVEPEQMIKFFSAHSEYSKECTRLVLIMEDIGGSERDEGPRSGVGSAMLNFLDGIDVSFRLPTFIVATTNHPENLLESLADRPGRFDLMLELLPPPIEQKIMLLEFFAQRSITNEEVKSLKQKEAENFSIAHLEEIVVRSELDDKTIPQVINELIAHSKKFKNSFQKVKKLGLNID